MFRNQSGICTRIQVTMSNCTECGAPDAACQARFNEFLALEFMEASFGAVHHLTVATFMLQHSSRLTLEGWYYERELLREFLVANKPPALVRRQNKSKVDNGRRDFKIKSKTGQPVIGKIRWMKTILDVHTNTAKIYCADVTAWARAALSDSELVVPQAPKPLCKLESPEIE